MDLKVRLRVHQTLSVEDPQRSDARKCVESDSGTDSPGRHVNAGPGTTGPDGEPDSERAVPVDLALFPHETRIPARSHRRVVARVDLRERAFYRFAISYEAIKYLSTRQCACFSSLLERRRHTVSVSLCRTQATSRTRTTCCRRLARR